MKVSVIIPAYNVENTIAETIQSVLAQTYRDFEIIVVDDCSSDQTRSVVAQSFELVPNATLLWNTKNQGIAETRNKAIAAATGEFILPLDADDKLHPQFLEKTVPLMTDTIGVVGTGMQYFGKSSIYIPPRETTTRANGIPVASLVRKSAVLQVGGYDITQPYEDWDLWVRITKAGWKIALLDQPLFLYRIGINARCGFVNKDDNWTKFQEAFRKRHEPTVALLVIATGERYNRFINRLITSAKKYFVPHDTILWTDESKQHNVEHLIVKHGEGFPNETYHRYHTFLDKRNLLEKYDYLFYIDVDAWFVDYVKSEDVFSDGITATMSPGYVGTCGTPERSTKSAAYLLMPRTYFAGGFIGGETSAFLQMAETIKKNIDIDTKNNILARYHDESHLNRYLYDNPPAKILNAGFCYPCYPGEMSDSETNRYKNIWRRAGFIDFVPKIALANKNKGINESVIEVPIPKNAAIQIPDHITKAATEYQKKRREKYEKLLRHT